MAAFSTAALLVCLLLGPVASLAAIATIDVGAAAVGNEWRPASCDAVKDGVVLTNMVANVKAIIDGCTIVLPSESNAAKSAVAIASFGAGSSIELRNCDISATFTADAQSAAIRFGTLAAGNSILLSNTTVTTVGKNVGGLLLAPGSAGSAVTLRVEHATFDVVGTTDVSAIEATSSSTFGADSKLTVVDSTAATRGRAPRTIYIKTAFGARGSISVLRSNITAVDTSIEQSSAFVLGAALSDDSTVSFSECAMNATGNSAIVMSFENAVTYGKNVSVSLHATNVTATSEGSVKGFEINQGIFGEFFSLSVTDSFFTMSARGDARALSLSTATVGTNASVKVIDTTMNATGENAFVFIFESGTVSGRPTFEFLRSNLIGIGKGNGYAPPLSIITTTWSNEGLALTMESSKFYSRADKGNIILLYGTYPAFTINIVSSVLEVFATSDGTPGTGMIAFPPDAQWNGGSLTVSDSALTLLEGSTAAAKARFVQWPDTISGFVPQTFESVTLSAPVGILTAAFTANSGGTYSGNTTFCANNVKWANGTAVVSGPPEFTAVTTCQVSHTVAPTPSLAATMTPRASKSLSLSSPPSPTLTPPRTASAAPSTTLSAPKTQSSAPTLTKPWTSSKPLTASKPLTKSKPQSKTMSVPPTRTSPHSLTPVFVRTETPLTPAPETPAPETPAPATPAPATPAPAHAASASSSASSAPTPAPVTPAPAHSTSASASSAATPAPATPASAQSSATPAPAQSSASSSTASSLATPAPATPAPATPAPPQGSSPTSASGTPAPMVTSSPAASGSSSEDSASGTPVSTPAPVSAPSTASGISAAVLLAITALAVVSALV